MDRHRSSDIFLFEGFRFDHCHGGLFRVDPAGVAEPVAVGSRALELLALLLERPGQLVSKENIMDAVWPLAAVEEGNLTVQMSSLRRLLDHGRVQGSCIQTLPRRGYRFITPVTRVAAGGEQSSGRRSVGIAPDPIPILRSPLDRPSVVVRPFINISYAINHELLSDGFAEDINTALSRYPSLFVRARNPSFAFKEGAIDTTQNAREQRVRYVIEGSVRSVGRGVRVTCRLIDAETNNHIWSERYDRNSTDFLAVQDEIAEAVAVAVAAGIAQSEQRRAIRQPTRSLTAWGAYQRGLWHRAKMTAADIVQAEQYFQQAIELDPNFVGGYRGLALARLDAATQFQKCSVEEACSTAEMLAGQAIALDRTDAEARSALAAVLLLGYGDHDGARIEAERALAMTSNLASAHGVLGAVLTYSGRPLEGLASLTMSIRLDPNHPLMAVRLQQVAAALYFAGDHAAAIDAARRAIRSFPYHPHVYRWLTAALVRLGRIPEARAALAKALAVASPSFDMHVRRRAPWMRSRDQAQMVDDLVRAGMRHNQSGLN